MVRVTAIVLAIILVGSAITFWVLRDETIPTVEVTEDLGVKRQVIGKSVEGREIESFTFGNSDRHILFVGGIHGGYEWNTVALSYQIIDYLENNPDIIPDDLAVTIIPSANPDGLYRVVKKNGRFSAGDVSKDQKILASGRFNAREVDLNRNFDCQWQPKSTWQSKIVNAGTKPFSEPESEALRKFILENKPVAVVSWHSQSGFVYASDCENGILPETLKIMNAYSQGSGYPAVKTFDAYKTSGDLDGWLASIGIPAITVELKTHQTIEFDQNLAGIKSLLHGIY